MLVAFILNTWKNWAGEKSILSNEMFSVEGSLSADSRAAHTPAESCHTYC